MQRTSLKHLLVLCLIILTSVAANAQSENMPDYAQLAGVRFWERWTQESPRSEYKKQVLFRCDNDLDRFCKQLCGNSLRCELPERYCRSCAGTSQMLLQDFFKNVGVLYLGTEEQFTAKYVLQILKSGFFITISSRSVYNDWYAFDDPNLRIRIQALCPNSLEERPLVIFSTDINRNPKSPEFVLCHSPDKIQAFRVIKKFDFNNQPNPQNNFLDFRG